MTSMIITICKFKQIKIKEVMDAIRTNMETTSDADDFHSDVDDTRELLEGLIDDFTSLTLTPLLVGLKRRLNRLVTINRLPVELFTHILLLTSPASEEEDQNAYPYVPYTWICHHWRSLLIQNPAFWTLIRLRPLIVWNWHIEPFYHELFRRSQSSKLDVILLCNSLPFKPMLERLFHKESDRIRRLHLSNEHQELTRLVLSGKRFPSLEVFALTDRLIISHQSRSLSRLLPILAASDHLETFECTLDEDDWGDIQKDHISVILGRIRHLNLTVYSPAVAQSILDLLHDNAKLQSLQFITRFRTAENAFSGRAVFPKLQSLSINDTSIMGHIQVPKLSSLDATWTFASDTLDCPLLDEFNFSSIKYLYIRENCPRSKSEGVYCIMGTKEYIQCETLFSARARGDIFSRAYPTDCFHLKFGKRGGLDIALKATLTSIIPRLTSLVELHLLSPHTFPVCREIIPQTPIQKLIVQSSNGLMGFCLLTDSSSSQSRTTPVLPNDTEMYADENIALDTLKCIDLRNCPPLSDIWLQELRVLGIEVITQKDVEKVVISRDTNIEKWTHL